MTSASSSRAFVQLTSSEEGNWLSLGRALTTVLCKGLRPFVKRETEAFYNNIKAIPALPCTCVHVPRRRPNPYHDMSTCHWAIIIEGYHHENKPNWQQSDPTKWMDPNVGPWEIAKLFLPDIGGHTVIQSVEDMDISAILNLMFWCNHFTVQRPLIKDVRDTRNSKWAHVSKLELSEAEKKDAFEAIEKFLQDPALAGDVDAQEALREILVLKCTSDVHIFKAEVLSHFKEAIQNELNRVKGQLRDCQRALENVEKKQKASISVPRLITSCTLYIVSYLGKSARSIRRSSLATLLVFLFLCCFIGVLDHRSYRDGCPGEDISVPFDSKEFNLTEYLTIARENFIGRRWLYQEIENAFDPTLRLSGVLIIGDPGAGKSALSAQLVCSRTSSRTIHDHVLGYHLCKHSDKNTQIAGKFVRNLAEMIARRLPEYGYIVSNSSYIQRSLNTDCVTIQDPVGCFEQTILLPLRSLTNVPKEYWYVVIDALDECLTQSETSHSIVYLLNNKLPRFPSWLKLVMTSRNESSVSLTSDSIKKLVIDPEDSRNIEDIELFLSTKFYQQDGPLLQRVKDWFGVNSLENTAKLISALLSKSQGNFLFVKEMLHHWETSRVARSDPYALPETLGELYHSYFQRLYVRREQFRPVRRVLELLVSTFQPLTQKEIFQVLRMKETSLDEDYDFKDRMKELGHFLRYGENDTITLYQLSLTEWLTSDSNRNGPFYVSKKKGHEVFCDYYFRLIAEGDKAALSRYILTLAQHIAYGGWKEAYVKEFLKFPSQVVNSSDPESNRTLLHLAATINSTDALELLLRHFSCIDCIDNRGITPAFLAAEHGLVDNVALMVRRGAKVNKRTKSLKYKFKDKHTSGYLSTAVLESKSKFWGSTMLHAAAHGGHLDVVNFLLNNGAFVSTVNAVHLTALQIAAENGHFRVVKALYEAGAAADQTALHHAAANNRLEVVKYLLQIGVKDKCMRCDGSFYWLKKEKYRFQSKPAVSTTTIPKKEHCRVAAKINAQTLKYDQASCFERGNRSKTFNVIGELFDDKHLISCETALHAATSSGHKAVVMELVSKDKWALACRDYTGRTPLHEAVRKNNTEIVKLLLLEDQTKVHASCDHWQDVQGPHEARASLTLSHEESMEYHQDICHCGYTPLHLAARYGYWKMAILLILKNGARIGAQDCFGATPLHVAACHNHWEMVHGLLELGAYISRKTLNGSTPFHSAAACGSVEVIEHLLYRGANLSVIDDSGLTALHYAILNIYSSQFQPDLTETRSEDSPRLSPIDRTGRLASFFIEDNYIKNTNHYRWLDTLIHLIIKGSAIDAVDKYGRTALHIAAGNGLADGVNVLLQKKARLEICDAFGKTPLEVAIENATAVTERFIRFTWLGKSLDQLQPYLRDHEMVVYLLLSAGVSFKKCSFRSGKSLLHRAIVNYQPYIAQILLLSGASLNRNCDDDSCLDTEGFTPLQRAAQGANIGVVRKLIKHGANVSLLSPQGHDALTLAILHVGGSIWQDPKELSGVNKVSDVAIELLRHKMKTRGFQIVCDPSKAELTLYHLAASRGLVKFIKHIFKDENLHQLHVDCPNSDGITPMYLAKIFGYSVKEYIYNPWAEVVRIIKNRGGRLQYPSRDAEYNAIYNRLYGWIPKDFKFDLKHDVRDFFIGLLTTYGYWQTNQTRSVPCQFNDMTRIEIGSPRSTTNLAIELLQQLVLLNQSQNSTMVSFAKDMSNCLNESEGVESSFTAYTNSFNIGGETPNLNGVKRSLFYLMEMWHEEFGRFRCLKMCFDTYKPYFVDETKSRLLIEQYKDSTPLWYLNKVCVTFEKAVRSHILRYRQGVTEFRKLYREHPDFINERMGWTVDRFKRYFDGLSNFYGFWPLQFLVKFSLGFYRQYDYLNVLNVGLEPKTHISLYLDKMRQMFLTARQELERRAHYAEKPHS